MSAQASRIHRIARFALVVADVVETELFLERAFDFVTVERRGDDPAFAALMGLPGVTSRQTLMRLGAQEVSLLAFDPPGRPYPPGSTSTDLWFQHFAIIVSDMESAYAQLVSVGNFTPISEHGPVTLPGGIEAFKFRDIEGHPLELLCFPPGKGPKSWQDLRGEDLFVGLDHSAISVGDTAASIAFFEKAFGLTLGEQTDNKGPAQASMDAVPGAHAIVSALMPQEAPPHVELLGYLVGTRRPIDGHTASNDIAATHFVMETECLDPVVEALADARAHFVSPGVVALADGTRAIAVLDPDGHRFVIEERSTRRPGS